MIILFWAVFGIVFYAYLGYLIVMFLLSKLHFQELESDYTIEPSVSLVVASYNEEDIIPEKLKNTQALDYPSEKIEQIWVTDGTTDRSNSILSNVSGLKLLYEPQRKGKIGALNRAVPYASNDILVFSDANSMLSVNALKEIIKPFSNKKVGCVAGSKQISSLDTDNPSISEGVYWKYEALIKKFESATGSTIGAAGELFAIRRELFEPVEPDTILDDFVIASRIALGGFMVKYAPEALAVETQSANISEEMKRKIRISAGGFQTMFRIVGLHNIFKRPGLVLKFWSHKVLRWLIVPFSLIVLFLLNILIVLNKPEVSYAYSIILWLQILLYLIASLGILLKGKKKIPGWFFFPYYFVVINYCQIAGFIKYLRKQQSVNWEKAKRS